MLKKIVAWSLAATMACLSLEPAAAGYRQGVICRPYTVEEVCGHGENYCRIQMVYAPHQGPGADRYGYWYSVPHRHHVSRHRPVAKTATVRHHVKTVHRHHASVHASYCTYDCWYKHPPEHGLPFGD
jgi:hypothetical protein